MLYLSIIYHMHQPYYKDLDKQEFVLPWVRLHGIKDYLDMVKILEDYPNIRLTFNLVPSLIEQLQDYISGTQDEFQKVSYKRKEEWTTQDKAFILENFFKIDPNRVISNYPRYLELLKKKSQHKEFNLQDYEDATVWFNLSWFDYYFKKNVPELSNAILKGRFFNHEDKLNVLNKQKEILSKIIPIYKEYIAKGNIEVALTPFYHPIMPLLYETKAALEANPQATLPKENFAYPEDISWHIEEGLNYFQQIFGLRPKGMWPSEQSVSENIIPYIQKAGINWIVTDEAILYRSINVKKRDTELLYQAHILKRPYGNLNILFRDRDLSDLIGFEYKNWDARDASSNFMYHLENINKHYKNKNVLVVIALDGENAWEYYRNDGWDFLNNFYKNLNESTYLKTVTPSEYLKDYPATQHIKHLATGSWIFGNFNKWLGSPQKNLAWDYLTKARELLEDLQSKNKPIPEIAWKQMHILEGSDWFWWYDEGQTDFDALFRLHLRNFYKFLGQKIPDYLNQPL